MYWIYTAFKYWIAIFFNDDCKKVYFSLKKEYYLQRNQIDNVFFGGFQ